MRMHVLGSGAGGGLPQWNCGCPGCCQARSGAIAPRTQDSVAVSVDGKSWVLLNASPDVRQQLERFAPLHPKSTRDSPIAAIVLTNADVDHCLGLFSLREGTPLVIYATESVIQALRGQDALCRTLERSREQTRWIRIVPGESLPLRGARDQDTGLVLEPVLVPGKLPPHLDGLLAPDPAHNIALLLRAAAGGKTLGYAPCVAGYSDGVERVLCESDLVLFDGTFWSNEELSLTGTGERSAEQMAHWPLSGSRGSLEVLERRAAGRAVLTHINNTNPILYERLKRRAVADAGVRIAEDGMDAIL